jgi:hypothetical protein
MDWRHSDVMYEALRFMPRSNMPKVCDGVAARTVTPKAKPQPRPAKAVRINRVGYMVREQGFVFDVSDVPKNVFSLADEVLALCGK